MAKRVGEIAILDSCDTRSTYPNPLSGPSRKNHGRWILQTVGGVAILPSFSLKWGISLGIVPKILFCYWTCSFTQAFDLFPIFFTFKGTILWFSRNWISYFIWNRPLLIIICHNQQFVDLSFPLRIWPSENLSLWKFASSSISFDDSELLYEFAFWRISLFRNWPLWKSSHKN